MKSLGVTIPGEDAAIFFETTAINIEWTVTKGLFGHGYWIVGIKLGLNTKSD